MEATDERKKKETEFHNLVRDQNLKADKKEYKRLTSNKKFYSIARKSDKFLHEWIYKHGNAKKLLDYCSGDGDRTILFAKHGVHAVGIDISDVSVENSKRKAEKERVENVEFHVMDAEHTSFPDNTFDAAACIGVLHHLDTDRAFKELARIVKPEGAVICNEPIAYNPVFQAYRRITPHLRTEWEMHHILGKKDFDNAKKYFNTVEMRFYHLATLFAVPFARTPLFHPLLTIFEAIDSILLKIPLVQWMAWQVIFIVSDPKKK